MYRIKCKVNRIFHPKAGQASSNDFYIFSVDSVEVIEGKREDLSFTKYGTLSVQGNLSECKVGQSLDISIEFKDASVKFGTSYKIKEQHLAFSLETEEDLKAFLGSLNITEKQVKAFLEVKDSVEWIRTANIDGLTKIKGVGERTAKRIVSKYEANKEMQKYFEKLYKLGFTNYTHRVKIVNHYIAIANKRATNSEGEIDKKIVDSEMNKLLGGLVKNPYQLTYIDGFGLKTVDEIAITYLKLAHDSKFRIGKFIEYILTEEGNKGRSYIPLFSTATCKVSFYTLLKKQLEIVKENGILVEKPIPIEDINAVMVEMQNEGKLLICTKTNRIALKYFYDLEMEVATELLRIHSKVSDNFKVEHKELIIQDIEKEQGFKFSQEQYEAIDKMLDPKNGVCILTGSAGAGKTTVSNAVYKVYDKYTVGQFAFAGKAAQRMSEVTGRESSTIHMYLAKGGSEEGRKKYDIYIVDESSMIHLELIRDLLKTFPDGSRLYLLGDIAQLQSLTTGNLLMDCIESGRIPVAMLTQVHRQGLESGILSASVDVRNRKQLCKRTDNVDKTIGSKGDLQLKVREYKEGLEKVALSQFIEYYENADSILEVQLLSPLRDRGDLSVNKLNAMIQDYLAPRLSENYIESNKLKFHVGDKVINTKNNYNAKSDTDEKVAVYNGSIGVVVDFIKDAGEIIGLMIDFQSVGLVQYLKEDCVKLNLAYAITVHSSQGSEFKNAIYVLSNDAYTLLNKEQIYTAITRAKKHCTIIAQSSALFTGIQTSEINSKLTFLCNMLKNIKLEG